MPGTIPGASAVLHVPASQARSLPTQRRFDRAVPRKQRRIVRSGKSPADVGAFEPHPARFRALARR